MGRLSRLDEETILQAVTLLKRHIEAPKLLGDENDEWILMDIRQSEECIADLERIINGR